MFEVDSLYLANMFNAMIFFQLLLTS